MRAHSEPRTQGVCCCDVDTPNRYGGGGACTGADGVRRGRHGAAISWQKAATWAKLARLRTFMMSQMLHNDWEEGAIWRGGALTGALACEPAPLPIDSHEARGGAYAIISPRRSERRSADRYRKRAARSTGRAPPTPDTLRGRQRSPASSISRGVLLKAWHESHTRESGAMSPQCGRAFLRSEHSPQKRHPQHLQWCRRRKALKLLRHEKQQGISESAVQCRGCTAGVHNSVVADRSSDRNLSHSERAESPVGATDERFAITRRPIAITPSSSPIY